MSQGNVMVDYDLGFDRETCPCCAGEGVEICPHCDGKGCALCDDKGTYECDLCGGKKDLITARRLYDL
jgi:hypothetical protein